MAFPSLKNKTNAPNDECSAQLITKQSVTNNVNPYYETFGINNDTNTTTKTISQTQKKKILKLRAKRRSELSPIISVSEENMVSPLSYKYVDIHPLVSSTPVTPNEQNKLNTKNNHNHNTYISSPPPHRSHRSKIALTPSSSAPHWNSKCNEHNIDQWTQQEMDESLQHSFDIYPSNDEKTEQKQPNLHLKINTAMNAHSPHISAITPTPKTSPLTKLQPKDKDSPSVRPKTASSVQSPSFFAAQNSDQHAAKRTKMATWHTPSTADGYSLDAETKTSPHYGSTKTLKKGTNRPKSSSILFRKRVDNMDNTLTSHKSGTTLTSMNVRKTSKWFYKKANYDADDENLPHLRRLKTARAYNKKFIIDRIQTQTVGPSFYRRRSCAAKTAEYEPPEAPEIGQSTLESQGMSFGINEDSGYEMITQKPVHYNYEKTTIRLRKLSSNGTVRYERHTVKTAGLTSRKQLVYIGGINDRNKYDVRDRLYDLFEMWGDDKPDISDADGSWNTDSIYVRFPSIAQAIDGINVFHGIQPNGYSLTAELVLEGSQMVYVDGLDGDWNEEIFKSFVDIRNNYKVSIKRIHDNKSSDKAYAFVQFQSLEAVQSAIDRFDGETEIDGKLVRWEHMVKAYVGKIGSDVTVSDIQKELSEFDPSFKHLPVEIRKSREPIYYRSNMERMYDTDVTSDDTERRKLKHEFENILHAQLKKPLKTRTKRPHSLSNKGSNDSNMSGNVVVTPRVCTGSIATDVTTTSSDVGSPPLATTNNNAAKRALSGGLVIPSLSTIISVGDLENVSGLFDPDSNDCTKQNILSPAINKHIIASLKKDSLDSLATASSFESGNLEMLEEIRGTKLINSSKSADCAKTVRLKPTFLTTPTLPTVLSSGDEAISMASIPLYSESINIAETPRDIAPISQQRSPTSPMDKIAVHLDINAMQENKEQIIQRSPLQRKQAGNTQFEYTRQILANAKKKKKAKVQIGTRFTDSLEGDDLQQRKKSVEEQKSAIPMLDETKSMSNNLTPTATATTPLSHTSNDKSDKSPIVQPTTSLFEVSCPNKLAHSRSVSLAKSKSNSFTHTPQPSNCDLTNYNYKGISGSDDSAAPIPVTVPSKVSNAAFSPKFSIASSSNTTVTTLNDTDSEMTSMTNNDIQSESVDIEPEYEWHHYAYIWFWNKYDAMRAQARFDKRHCFGACQITVRFLLMNDMTQKVYISGLMEGYTNQTTIEQDIAKYISGTPLWRKKCIVTYRHNGIRPFAYLRFPSVEATREAIHLFNNQVCFGNQRFQHKRGKQRIHVEIVRDESDLLSHHVSRRWNARRYWYLSFAFLLLPLTLTYQWLALEWSKLMGTGYNDNDLLTNNYKYCNAKELAPNDLLASLCSFDDVFKIRLMNKNWIRLSLMLIAYALYVIFYFLIRTIVHNYNNSEVIFSALSPIFLYVVIAQLWSCWCAMHFEVCYPQFHMLEHVSMFFEDSMLYSRIHVMASDFASSKTWNCITYPWHYPIQWKKRLIVPALIYPLMCRLPALLHSDQLFDFPDHTPYANKANNGWDVLIESLAALLMFWFCYILFCAFNTITLRTLSYWKEVHSITELITLKSNSFFTTRINNRSSFNFLRLDNENNLFAWLSLRSFIHRKGDVVFCGLEMQGLFLVIMVFFNLATLVIIIFVLIDDLKAEDDDFKNILLNSGFILSQSWFLCVCMYYMSYMLLIGYWFGKENEYQLNRVERQKLFLYTERMKQLLNHEKYKLCDNTKISDLKLLLNSMEALVQHVETKEITPSLWGIKMNDFKWKIVMTVIAAVIPSVAVRWMLNVN